MRWTQVPSQRACRSTRKRLLSWSLNNRNRNCIVSFDSLTFILGFFCIDFSHAVRDDLQWIRPWPKFLSIKAVVFLTFWQGLMILIFVVVLADPSEKADATARAQNYQNLLICLEMLLFSLWQWVCCI